MEHEGSPYPEEGTISDAEYLREMSLNPRVSSEIQSAREALQNYIPNQQELDKVVRNQIERMLRFARVDGLTGLVNQEGFKNQIGVELKRMERLGAPTAMMFIDLDWFKKVNDEFGHPAGDAALIAVAEFLRRMVRPSDTVGRLGGDEAGILLPGIGIGAVGVANRIQSGIAMLKIPGFPEANGIITTSIGIAVAGKGETIDSLYKRADQGSLWSKANGKATTSFMPTLGKPYQHMQGFPNIHFIKPDAGPAPVLKGR